MIQLQQTFPKCLFTIVTQTRKWNAGNIMKALLINFPKAKLKQNRRVKTEYNLGRCHKYARSSL